VELVAIIRNATLPEQRTSQISLLFLE